MRGKRAACRSRRHPHLARPAQCAERGGRVRRGARAWPGRRTPFSGGLNTFPGLPHRLEEVGRKGRVLFVNDSKATNANSADKALSSFPGEIFWILGGKAKEGGITPLTRFFPKIAKAYLIGEATEEFAARCWTGRCLRALRHARCRHRQGGRRCGALRRRRSRWCCCRPPARPSTSTGTSRSAATTSAKLVQRRSRTIDAAGPAASCVGKAAGFIMQKSCNQNFTKSVIVFSRIRWLVPCRPDDGTYPHIEYKCHRSPPPASLPVKFSALCQMPPCHVFYSGEARACVRGRDHPLFQQEESGLGNLKSVNAKCVSAPEASVARCRRTVEPNVASDQKPIRAEHPELRGQRVPQEILFGGLRAGELFVARNAATWPWTPRLGSIESSRRRARRAARSSCSGMRIAARWCRPATWRPRSRRFRLRSG